MSSAEALAAAFAADARARLGKLAGLIRHAAGQLTDEQLWWRPRPDMNSPANLALHLAGNVRWLIGSCLAGGLDARDRRAEFMDRSGRPGAEVLAELDAALAEADAALARLTAADLARESSAGGDRLSGLELVARCVNHFAMHAQEVVVLARLQLGEAYRFQGPPPYRPEES